MGYPAMPVDANGIPIACVFIPGVGFVALQGGTGSNTDGNGNVSTPVATSLNQIGNLPVQMSGSDAETTANLLGIQTYRFNGTTSDQERNNSDGITILNVSNVTVTQNSTVQTNYNWRGAYVVLQTTTIGSGSVTLSIVGVEPVNSNTWTILTGAAVTTNTVNVYTIYPGATAVANSVVNAALPRSWQVIVTANNANAATYNVQASMVL